MLRNATMAKVLTIAGQKTDECISPRSERFRYSNNFLDPILSLSSLRGLSNGTTPTCAQIRSHSNQRDVAELCTRLARTLQFVQDKALYGCVARPLLHFSERVWARDYK